MAGTVSVYPILPDPQVASLEERVAALEAAMAMLMMRKLLARGDITINDARAAHGLPPFPEEASGAA